MRLRALFGVNKSLVLGVPDATIFLLEYQLR